MIDIPTARFPRCDLGVTTEGILIEVLVGLITQEVRAGETVRVDEVVATCVRGVVVGVLEHEIIMRPQERVVYRRVFPALLFPVVRVNPAVSGLTANDPGNEHGEGEHGEQADTNSENRSHGRPATRAAQTMSLTPRMSRRWVSVVAGSERMTSALWYQAS